MAIPAVLQNRLSLPIVAAPLFIVSTPDLVIAQCKAGIVGSFPALNARPVDMLDVWLARIRTELAEYQLENPRVAVGPFAVNQICHPTNDRLMHDTDLCVKHEVPVIITSLQADKRVIEATHSYGGIVLHDATTIRHAEKALEHGVDGLILVCAGAGGHAGTLSPFALVSEVRSFYDGPILLSGAIANGASILAAQALGADMAYIGTRFIATAEANASPEYKQMLVDSVAEDIVYSSLFSGVPANYLKASVTRAGLDPEALAVADKSTMNFGSGGNTDAKVWRDIWGAGHGTGSIKTIQTVAECVAQLQREYDAARIKLNHAHF
jgi:nitronate monooxygenase